MRRVTILVVVVLAAGLVLWRWDREARGPAPSPAELATAPASEASTGVADGWEPDGHDAQRGQASLPPPPPSGEAGAGSEAPQQTDSDDLTGSADLPRAYQAPEMRKVGHYLEAWLVERPANDADADQVDVDCDQLPCLLSFDCDGATAEAMGFNDLLLRQLGELTSAANPRLFSRPRGDRLEFIIYFEPPGANATQLTRELVQRRPGAEPVDP